MLIRTFPLLVLLDIIVTMFNNTNDKYQGDAFISLNITNVPISYDFKIIHILK